jgi:hypothetical protein
MRENDLAKLEIAENSDTLPPLKPKASAIESWPWLFGGTFKRGTGRLLPGESGCYLPSRVKQRGGSGVQILLILFFGTSLPY